MFVAEEGTVTLRDQAGNRLGTFNTLGFYPYRKARLGDSLCLLQNITFRYKGPSGGDNHRVYQLVDGGYLACSDFSVSIGTVVNA